LDGAELLLELQCVRRELEQLVEDAKRGDVLRQGLQVALVGRPNVGKSSLLNRLSRRERAIVTDLPGTTRDVLESEIVLEGVPITLVDTAGIRATQDALEQLGIDRSHQALAAADVVLLVFDLSLGWTHDDAALLAQIPDDLPRLLVGNKADLQPASMAASLSNQVDVKTPDVMLSALTGQGEEALIEAVLKTCGASEAQGLVVALNQRQQDLAATAAIALARTQEAAEQKLPWDFWTIDLRQAISSLGEITGEEITEAVLDRIFSRFCIGK
ncbi:MAG: GTPase, partial [Cyanobacteriota bacterium]|nr:GTPase [Cyanobacteriota bacterium]